MGENLQGKLFDPIQIGAWNLRNRTVMAQITRCFADDQTGVVGPDVVEYYRKRAADGIGLIISEGIMPTIRGKGSVRVPGLYSPEQTAAWKQVTDAVHAEGGTIIAQLWHAGRKSHHELTGGFPLLFEWKGTFLDSVSHMTSLKKCQLKISKLLLATMSRLREMRWKQVLME
jgi:N-ethylmaleimide reductase